MTKVVGIRFKTGGKVYFFDPKDFDIKKGDHVIVDTARGLECGLCVQGVHEESPDKIIRALKEVTRIASPQETPTNSPIIDLSLIKNRP